MYLYWLHGDKSIVLVILCLGGFLYALAEGDGSAGFTLLQS